MTFIDTNVILDVLQNDSSWATWSIRQLAEARARGDLFINSIVIAELCRDYRDLADLRSALVPFAVRAEPLDDAAAFMAGRRFIAARAERGQIGPARPLPDFFIGAHALILGSALLTRDTKLYQRYFPELTLITPETHP